MTEKDGPVLRSMLDEENLRNYKSSEQYRIFYIGCPNCPAQFWFAELELTYAADENEVEMHRQDFIEWLRQRCPNHKVPIS